jgi:hypothetical protein
MEGTIDVIAEDKEEGILVLLGGVVLFGSGEVEGDNPLVLVRDGEFGEDIAGLWVDVSHAADDDSGSDAEIFFCSGQALVDGFHDACETHTLTGVEDGAIADLEVTDVLGSTVLDQLIGDTIECLGILHDGERDVKGGKVLDEGLALGRRNYMTAQAIEIGGR